MEEKNKNKMTLEERIYNAPMVYVLSAAAAAAVALSLLITVIMLILGFGFVTDTTEDGLANLEYNTGLKTAEGITEAAVYGPMMGSIAYEMTMVRVKEGADVKAVAEAMGVDTTGMDQAAYRKAAIDAVRQLSIDVGIPTKLEKIKEEDLQFLAESAYADACAPGNPKEASVEDMKALIRQLM